MSLACIKAAINELDNIPDEELRDSLRVGLKQLAESKILNDNERLIRAKLLMREERAKIYQLEVADLMRKRIEDEWAVRFTGDAEHDTRLLSDAVRQSTDIGPRAGQTMESRVLAAKQHVKGKLFNMVKFFGGRDGDLPVLLELIQPGLSRNSQVATEVANYRKLVEPLLKKLRDEGGVYVEPDYQYFTQRLSPAKIAADSETFLARQAELLDENWHADPSVSAQRYYATMVTRHMSEPDKQVISLAKQMHYRTDDPERLARFLIDYSEDTVARQLERSAENIAESLVIALELGPDPGKLINNLRERIVKRSDLATHPKKAELEKELTRVQTAWEVVSGQLAKPLNASAAQMVGAAKATANGLLLGNVTLSQSVQDELLAPVLISQRLGQGYGRALSDYWAGHAAMIADPELRARMAEDGFYEHMFHMGSATARYSMEGTTEGIAGGAKRFGTIAYALTGAWHIEQGQRGSAAYVYSRGIARNLKNNWGELDTRFQTFLMNNGVNEKMWGRWQANHTIDKHGMVRLSTDLTTEDGIAFGGLMHTAVNNTILRPDAWTRAFLSGNARAGTLPGSLAALTTHMMSWPVQFVRSAMMTSYKRGLSDVAVVGVTAMAGAIAYLQLRALLKHEPMYEWDSPTLWLEALKRSALMTPLGDPILDLMTGKHAGASFMDSAALGVATRVAGNLAKGTASAVFEEESDKAASYFFRAGYALTPNIWWLDASLRIPAMLAIMETIDPDYIRRREQRFKKEGRMGYE